MCFSKYFLARVCIRGLIRFSALPDQRNLEGLSKQDNPEVFGKLKLALGIAAFRQVDAS